MFPAGRAVMVGGLTTAALCFSALPFAFYYYVLCSLEMRITRSALVVKRAFRHESPILWDSVQSLDASSDFLVVQHRLGRVRFSAQLDGVGTLALALLEFAPGATVTIDAIRLMNEAHRENLDDGPPEGQALMDVLLTEK